MLAFIDNCVLQKGFSATIFGQTGLGGPGLLCVCLLQKGNGALWGVDAPLPAREGDILLFPGSMSFSPTTTCRLAVATLGGAIPRQMAESLAGEAALLPQMAALAPLVAQLAQDGPKLPASEASALAYTLLCRLGQALDAPHTLPPLVEAALGEMRAHFAEVYGVEELAETLLVSKSHLIRSFTAALGLPPGKYLTQIRVENAKRLLLHGEYSLDIVASLCGFSGAIYLCKVFKRQTGETPAAWRKRMGVHPAGAATTLEEQVYL